MSICSCSLIVRIALPGCVQISILNYQIRFIAADVFSCFDTQAIDVCWGGDSPNYFPSICD